MKLLLVTTLFVVAVLHMSQAQNVECKIDLLMLIDKSGSITQNGNDFEPWYQATNFTLDVINSFVTEQTQTNAAFVTFGNRESIFGDPEPNYLSGDKARLTTLVNNVRDSYALHNTNTSSALYVAQEIFNKLGSGTSGDRADVPDVIILLTDGKPTFGLNRLANVAQSELDNEVRNLASILKARGVVIITVAVAIADEMALELLQDVATDPVDNFISTMDFSTLRNELTDIVDSTCRSIPVVSPCRQNADIYFAIDSSESIQRTQYNDIKQFVANVQHDLPLLDGATKTGLVQWSNAGELVYNLNAYTDIYEAGNATVDTAYLGEKTNTQQVLNTVLNRAFTPNQGDRADFPNILVVFTDGNSNMARPEDMFDMAFQVKTNGIHVIVIGIGNWFNKYELQSLASDPYKVNYIHVTDTADLLSTNEYRDQLKALLCNDVNDCAPNPCAPGTTCQGQCMDKIGTYTCYCPDSCSGTDCQRNCNNRMNTVFAVDSSGSMMQSDFRAQLDFVNEVISNLNMNSDDKVGFMSFSMPEGSSVEMSPLFGINEFDNMDLVKNGITTFFRGGSTNTYDAISTVRTSMMTGGNENPYVLVILTDGRSMDFSSTWEEARMARESGINVIVVAIGNQFQNWDNPQKLANIVELQSMATGMDNNNIFYVENFAALKDYVDDVSDAVCNNIGECEMMNCQNGGTTRDRMGYCECDCPTTPLFAGPNCERQCTGQLDIVLVIDASGSMRSDRFVDVKNFIIDLVKHFPMTNNQARFGAIYFDNDATVAFNLDKYTMMEDVITHIQTGIPFMGGNTHTAAALNLVPTVFNNGGRDNVDKFVFFISDGKSNVNEQNTINNAIDLRESGFRILTLGIGSDAAKMELRAMASDPMEKFLKMVPSFSSILTDEASRMDTLEFLVDAMCDSENECDSNPCDNSGTSECFDEYHGYYCECNFQRSGKDCTRTCPAQLDVTLLMDFSSSMEPTQDWLSLSIAMAKDLVYGLPNDARVAVVTYSTQASVKFNLNKYQSKLQVLNALSFGESGGSTDTLGAISALNTVYTSANGNRQGFKNVAIFLTDGGSNVLDTDLKAAAEQASANIAQGLERFVIALGQYEMREVNAIASDPDNSYVFEVRTSADASVAVTRVLDEICQ